MNYIVALIALFFPAISWGAVDTSKTPPDLAVGSMIASLLLVIACIFIFAFLMKKSNLVHNGRGKSLIKVIATQPLTNKGRVQIIEINKKRYLLGVTEQNINVLDTFELSEDEVAQSLSEQTAPTSFSSLLSKISAKRNE
ncbi:flagellar biosynthetic protein FliO [Psychromonas sp. KJ10-10]|uniref:flagellar biosynthetic protein FliO n=1 Tax=Psychromonas sp. KJ10-10 TaxID=3391823 RepID=UPI0039B5643A